MHEGIVKVKFGRNDLIIETGRLAKQANGSVTVSYGGTVVLVTACMSREIKEGRDFFPLTVECQEKTYAAGRIPGGFFKREGRPSESEILTARLIDRPIRPLFPEGFLNEVQVMAIVLSSDGENDPDILAVIGASTALSLSEIPFNGPLAACRVGLVNNEFVLNPTYAELGKSELDLVVVANSKGVVMLESRAREVTEERLLEAVKFGVESLGGIINLQKEFSAKHGKKKASIEFKKTDPALKEKVAQLSKERLARVYGLSKKEEREEEMALLCKELEEKLISEEDTSADIKIALTELEKEQVRKKIIEQDVRFDGRGLKEIRPIQCEISVLPRTHGSCLFTRGQTQSLAVTTLGTGDDEQLIEALEGEKYKTFMLHYSFPPFSVGETKPVRGPGRREIGHGALAERSLLAVVPPKKEAPYTILGVSPQLAHHSSFQMGTGRAPTLRLYDVGGPVKDGGGGGVVGVVLEKE
ncbi:MAG: polyribonucleotide nucleotidyltransferase [Candidatus Omnitrophica bacterium]|nr:polyribonucleotide nucleotidyltransferase [Candidatus Omnitrophota bacterium]